MSIDTKRLEYDLDLPFEPQECPIRWFDDWYQAACKSSILEPNAMALATVNAEGHPNVRMVLLKGFDDRGFCFYSNVYSQKGRELKSRSSAALCLYWDELQRQVRIVGTATALSEAEVRTYFEKRPRGAQLAAWVSQQSSTLDSFETLQGEYAAFEAQVGENDSLDLPPHWGGYRVVPTEIEFWQGAKNRLHQRVRYSRSTVEHEWEQRLLYP